MKRKMWLFQVKRFSATRRTVRAICFQRVLDNYTALLKLWEDSLHTRRQQPDVRGRIIGCQAQMKTLNFFFGLHLGKLIFGHTNNLSATLQKFNMSAVCGQQNAKLTTDTPKKIRNDASFNAFFETVLKKKELLDDVSDPEVPWKRRVPARCEDIQAEPFQELLPPCLL